MKPSVDDIARHRAEQRWEAFAAEPVTAARLQAFHSANKILLLAHNQKIYRQLGPLVASAPRHVPNDVVDAYGQRFLEAIRTDPTRGSHADALLHIYGVIRELLDADKRRELTRVIESYRSGAIDIDVPLALLRSRVTAHPVEWAMNQTYLFSPLPPHERRR